MGIAGDMLSAALLELCPDKEAVLNELNSMGLEGVSFKLEKAEKCGVTGSHFSVIVNGVEEESSDIADGHDHHHDHDNHHHDHDEDHDLHHDHNEDHDHHHHEHDEDHDHHHAHHSMHDIEHIVEKLAVSEKIKKDVMSVYRMIAEAESSVHGVPVSDIHFHEVGRMDAIADITASCLLLSKIGPDVVMASPVNVGSGMVKCAHGILPVPAPATAHLLQGIPSYSSDIKGELCTPTGAALLKFAVDKFGDQPVMSIEKIGYGMGKKDFPKANLVRAMLGSLDTQKDTFNSDLTDSIIELVCNLDDMTPEEIGFATEELLREGAADVFTTPIFMKKNRPGTMLTVLCHENEKEHIVRAIFKHTTTIGIRESVCHRYILGRTFEVDKTSLGDVNVKVVSGYGVSRKKPEYEDVAKLARENKTCFREALPDKK